MDFIGLIEPAKDKYTLLNICYLQVSDTARPGLQLIYSSFIIVYLEIIFVISVFVTLIYNTVTLRPIATIKILSKIS